MPFSNAVRDRKGAALVVQRQSQAGSVRFRAISRARAPGWPSLHRGSSRLAVKDLYASDHVGDRPGGRFRWLISTCLAAAVGAIAIFVVIYGSSDPEDTSAGLLPTLKRMGEGAVAAPSAELRPRQEGLKWLVPRTDRLQVTSGAMSTRFTIHEMLRQRVAGRDKIFAKRYVRIVGRLAAVPANYSDVIPPFNPFRLLANNNPVGSGDVDIDIDSLRSDVSVKVVELHGGILPEEDGQELADTEILELVSRSDDDANNAASESDPAQGAGGALAGGTATAARLDDAVNTTVLTKTDFDAEDEPGESDGPGKIMTVTVAAGDTLAKILVSAGAEKWQAAAMVEAAEKVFPASALAQGQEIEITVLPSITRPDRTEPVRFSVYAVTDGRKELKVAVTRNAAGEFVASTDMTASGDDLRPALGEGDQPQASSLYSSVYYAALIQQIPPDIIQQILKVHVYDTDFRRRIRAGDQIELFFDPKEETAVDGPPGDLLMTAITAGGDMHRFYRFRTSDGAIDFYDAEGNNSKKFLMRKPVRGDDVRLTSGYGVRFHPLLGDRKMHTGVDWAAPHGTPILAAGNGTIEEAGRKGQYGNYVRIRHANGYQTAYGHMSRIAEGVGPGVKVRQGQTIGYIGSTGLSSGPHLHFEVLVNTRFVDPMSIQVPRERQLTGAELADFQKERARIDDLMRRAPVKTQMTASR